jgi:hypothetical protein
MKPYRLLLLGRLPEDGTESSLDRAQRLSSAGSSDPRYCPLEKRLSLLLLDDMLEFKPEEVLSHNNHDD